jgi:NitT/TauT family transport system substrate-binding protein
MFADFLGIEDIAAPPGRTCSPWNATRPFVVGERLGGWPMTLRLTRRSVVIGTGAGLLATPYLARGQAALPKVRLTTGFALQGTHSYMLRAQKMGYARELGADLVVSRGFGSGRVPIDISGGIFDMGYNDMSTSLRFMAENPGADLIVVAILQDTNQISITVRADGPIATVKDLEGRTIAAPDFDIGRQLFPPFARGAGLDIGKVKWLSVALELREPMLVQNRADGISGQASSTALSLKRLGMDLPQQRIFLYRDSGFDAYSECFVASRKFVERNPQAIKATLAGLFRAYVEYYHDPKESLQVLKEVEPLTDVAIEAERITFQRKMLPLGELMKKQGLSTVDPKRLESSIRMIEDAFGMPRRLSNDQVYTDAYLPPPSARMV